MNCHATTANFRTLVIVYFVALVAAAGQVARPPKTSTPELLEQFKATKIFWQQLEVAKKLVRFHDATVLQDPAIVAMLASEDRHLRGNAAFVFVRLGDARGIEVLQDMLDDKSQRPMGQRGTTGRWSVHAQIRSDRYYTVHILGELKDRRAVPILVPLLRDDDVAVRAKAAWALGEIGDGSAIDPLVAALDDKDLHVRAAATEAIDKLRVKQLLPRHRPTQ